MAIISVDININTNVITNKQWLPLVAKIYIENKSIDSKVLLDYPLVIIDSDGNGHLIYTKRYWTISTFKSEFSKYSLSTNNLQLMHVVHVRSHNGKYLCNEKLIIDFQMNENYVILAICSTKGGAVLQLVTRLRSVDDNDNNNNKSTHIDYLNDNI